jgi:hypothetical protein
LFGITLGDGPKRWHSARATANAPQRAQRAKVQGNHYREST